MSSDVTPESQVSKSRLVETHISTLLFVDDVVYKRKRPVQTDFVDFTTLNSRRDACSREVELNRRLAADVYLGVADVMLDGVVIDHFVVMRQLPASCRLSAILTMPSASEELRTIAQLIAAFHRNAATGVEIDAASGFDAVTQLWQDGMAVTSRYTGSVLDGHDSDRLARLVREYFFGRQQLFDARVAQGCAVDGHGDLQAEDIFCCEDGPRVLDCLEFSDRLRYGDRLNDVAFLAMDLERLGHRDLAEAFLDVYGEMSGTSWPRSLEHFYIAYRAHVRMKVACIRHDQGDQLAADAARSLHRLALAHLESGRVRLVLVGGSPGAGKTSVGRGLAAALGAVLVSSDVVREEIQPRSDFSRDRALNVGRYQPKLVDAVYQETLDRARRALSLGEHVVLDCSWLHSQHRAWARHLASDTASVLVELRCVCVPETAERRIADRAVEGNDPSEATVAVARTLPTEAEPWPEAHLVNTDDDLDTAVAAAERIVADVLLL